MSKRHLDLERIRTAAEEADLDPRARAEIEEVLRVAAMERHLKNHYPDRLLHIERLAESALNSADSAWRWLRSAHGDLGAVPLDLLQSETGAAQVEHELGRIEYGVYS